MLAIDSSLCYGFALQLYFQVNEAYKPYLLNKKREEKEFCWSFTLRWLVGFLRGGGGLILIFLLRYSSHNMNFTILKCIGLSGFGYINHVVEPLPLIPEYFHHSKKKPVSSHLQFPPPHPLVTSNMLSVSIDIHSLSISYKRITHYVAFCVWLLSLGIMFHPCGIV